MFDFFFDFFDFLAAVGFRLIHLPVILLPIIRLPIGLMGVCRFLADFGSVGLTRDSFKLSR